MTELYLRVLELLTPTVAPTDEKELEIYNQLKKIRWIDLDKGQLENFDTRPAVQFPCLLISIQLPRTVTQGKNNLQMNDARISTRLAFDFLGSTASNVNSILREQSLDYFNISQASFLALQGKKSIGSAKFDRVSVFDEPRADFKVVATSFETSYLDSTAVQ